jgi:hypothetical protein
METIEVETYWANIYVGRQTGYDGNIHSLDYVKAITQKYVNEVKLGLTFTSTIFIYVDGEEPGVIIGLINYPRFPSTKEKIQKQAIDLAEMLKKELQQHRVSIVFPDKTIMLGEK